MPVSMKRIRQLLRISQIGVITFVVLGLIGVGMLVWKESTWAPVVFRESESQAFQHGSIGTELMPLPVAHVLPELFPEHFQPRGVGQGDWIEQFGFIRSDDPLNDGLPVGFSISQYRSQSASPSPVAFVGFSCALCHSTRIESPDSSAVQIVYGPGSVSLDLFAWLDAFQASLLQREPLPGGDEWIPDSLRPYVLTTEKIQAAYKEMTGRDLHITERAMIALWLREIRNRLNEGLPRFDEPFGYGLSQIPDFVPTGPSRTQPFRTLVRQGLQRPGNDMAVYTKIATVFSQDLRTWAQFDGTIADLAARSSMAAFAAGATVENMRHPEIVHNIRQASEYTRTLRPPKYEDLFPVEARKLKPQLLERGREVYREHCFACHGGPDGPTGKWSHGARHGEVVPLSELQTDPERVLFRHYGKLPDLLFRAFPPSHPFHIQRDRMRPLPGDTEKLEIRGYVNAPIDGVFLRAPYLHNASVLTLAELINLKPRRPVFYRGQNYFDPIDVGFLSPETRDERHYFRFDTRVRGNSNLGHEYPWRHDDPERNEDDLRALLDYLKSL